jgi:hypothetical protein
MSSICACGELYVKNYLVSEKKDGEIRQTLEIHQNIGMLFLSMDRAEPLTSHLYDLSENKFAFIWEVLEGELVLVKIVDLKNREISKFSKEILPIKFSNFTGTLTVSSGKLLYLNNIMSDPDIHEFETDFHFKEGTLAKKVKYSIKVERSIIELDSLKKVQSQK